MPSVYQPGNGVAHRCASACLSSIILSPLNGYVKMSPYETGDICIEPERIAASGGDFLLREGGAGGCPRPLTAQPQAPTNQTTPKSVSSTAGGGARPTPTHGR